MKPMHKITYASGAYRTMRADSVEEVVERLTTERAIVGKDYESLGVVSIEKQKKLRRNGNGNHCKGNRHRQD